MQEILYKCEAQITKRKKRNEYNKNKDTEESKGAR
jgi:hypothetical protein